MAPGAYDESSGSFAKIPPPHVGGTSIDIPKRNHGANGYECGISFQSLLSLWPAFSLQALLSLWPAFSLQALLSLQSAFSLQSLLSLWSGFSLQALLSLWSGSSLWTTQGIPPLLLLKLLVGQSSQGTNQIAFCSPVPKQCQKNQGNYRH